MTDPDHLAKFTNSHRCSAPDCSEFGAYGFARNAAGVTIGPAFWACADRDHRRIVETLANGALPTGA